MVTVSEIFTTEPSILMDVICGNAGSLCMSSLPNKTASDFEGFKQAVM